MAVYKPTADTGVADEVPDNPLAQNAATGSKKPIGSAPAVGATLDDPNAPQLPGVEKSSATPPVNMDPNAYATPPQAQTALPDMQVAPPAPMPTLSGDWQAPTASANSAPLIASAAGGTMTPQGDATNAFRGYETDTGGKFGGYADPNANITGGMSFKQFDETALKNAQALGLDKLDYRGLPDATFNAMMQSDPGADLVKQKIVSGQPLTEQEKMYYAKVRGPELSAGVPVLGNAPANSTAADPAEQAALLAGQAAGTVPSGPGLPPVAPAGAPNLPPVPTGPATGMPTPPGEQAVPVTGTPPVNIDPGTTATPGANPALPTPAPSGQPATASGMGNVAQTATTAENALTNATLSRAPGADRFKIAQEQADAAAAAGQPQYEADLRQAMRKAAAGGALGSGMLQTSIGDIAQNRDLSNRTNRQNLLSEALKGTIGDQFGDVGIAERQQAFQKTQQEQAFGNAKDTAKLEEDLTSGAFERSLKQLIAGSGGNPADTALLLSQIFGGQASEAGSSLAALLGGLGQRSTAGGGGNNTMDLLSAIYKQLPISGQQPTYQRPDTMANVPEGG